ncbi:hypothetical protein RRF57_000990 [Xylaria bambusicola]|uniref:Protein kinase domain-containing protein n=1 Tax=Xylaria bambusicola TaxID=326684 RepID=A0AAN7UFM3_9PEZI
MNFLEFDENGIPIDPGDDPHRSFEPSMDVSGNIAANIVMAEEEINARAIEARNYFNNLMHFEYEDLVGNGAFGIAVRVKWTGVGRSRRFIVKRARNEDSARELRHEIDIMAMGGKGVALAEKYAYEIDPADHTTYAQNLNGAAHIASVIAYEDDRRGGRRRRYQQWRLRSRFARRVASIFGRRVPSYFLVGLPGPSLALEYLENGTMDRFRKKLDENNDIVPNRILWRIFLCWADSKLEEFGNIPPSRLVHGDMHPGNMLFGTIGDFPEHDIVPPVKLIDFGLSFRNPVGVMWNISDIAKNMMWLIIQRLVPLGVWPLDYNDIVTEGAPLLDAQWAPKTRHLDPELLDILLRCLAQSPLDRPTLAQLLQVAKDAVQNRDQEYYGAEAFQESDVSIQRFVQQYIYDA